MADGLGWDQVFERTAATAIVAILAWFVCLATEMFRHIPSPERKLPVEPDRPINHLLMAAARSAIGAGIAIFLSYAFGANHPAWAAMGALAVMQGVNLHVNMNRALQRMAGTVVGASLAWMVLMQDPTVWFLIALLAGLQPVIGVNYAFGQVLVTPMALLMTYLGAAGAAGPEMAPERVLDTVLGAVVGICMAVLLSTIDDRRHLAELRRAGLDRDDDHI